MISEVSVMTQESYVYDTSDSHKRGVRYTSTSDGARTEYKRRGESREEKRGEPKKRGRGRGRGEIIDESRRDPSKRDRRQRTKITERAKKGERENHRTVEKYRA